MSSLSNPGGAPARENESRVFTSNPVHPVVHADFGSSTHSVSRFSRLRPQARTGSNDLRGRVIFGIAHDHNSSAAGFDLIALGNGLHRVISALDMKIGTDFANDGAHVFFGENNDSVNILERRQNLRALGLRHHRPSLTFQGTHGSIGIDCDNQFALKFTSGVQIAHMAHMKQIEAAVGEDDAIPGAPPIRNTQPEFVARHNFPME